MTNSPFPPLPKSGHEAVLTIDLDAIAINYRFFRDRAKGARVGGVLKANAYGLGALPVAQTLVEEGCDLIFVATAQEATELRAKIPDSVDVYTSNGYQSDHKNDYVYNYFYPILNSLEEVQDWAKARSAKEPTLPCGLQIDTGMNRSGLPKAELKDLLKDPSLLSKLNIQLIMSHLACADDPTHQMNEEQRIAFKKAAENLPRAPLSLANSAGILNGQDYLFDVARPGIGLYGGQPLAEGGPDLTTVAYLHAPILQIRQIETGESVGYGATYTVARPSRIATVGVGYGDGYMRHLSNAGVGWLDGERVPIAGRVSMDLTGFDITDVPAEIAKPGTFIELLGKNLSIEEVGNTAGTFGYEILTSLGTRYRRRYIRNGKVVRS